MFEMKPTQSSIKEIPVSPKSIRLTQSMPYPTQSFIDNYRDSVTRFSQMQNFSFDKVLDKDEEYVSIPKMVKLANTDGNNITLQQQALAIFKHYKSNPIVFVGIYGKQNAGKSFWFDKTLNLAKVEGNWYTKQKDEIPCLKFFGTPYKKGNIRMFLLDCTGFKNQELTRQQQIRLDFMMSICSMVILMPDPSDSQGQIMKTAYHHFTDSQERLRYQNKNAGKGSPQWPQTLYCLYRSTIPVKKELQRVGQLFPDYNFSIIHDAKGEQNYETKGGQNIVSLQNFHHENQDIKNDDNFLNQLDIFNRGINKDYKNRVQIIFEDIYSKLRPKEYGNLKSYGRVMGVLLPQVKNGLAKQEKQDFQNIYDQTTKKLYIQNHRDMQKVYSDVIQKKFNADDPESTKVILQSYKDARQKAYNRFDKETLLFDPDSPYHQQYEEILEKQIQNQQNIIKNVKIKKSNQLLEKSMKVPIKLQTNDDAFNYLEDLRNTDKDLDHEGRSKVVGNKLKQACENNKKFFFILGEDFDQVEGQLEKKKREYDELEKQAKRKLIEAKEKGEQKKLLQLKESRLVHTYKIQNEEKEKNEGENVEQQRLRLEKEKQEQLKVLLNQTKLQKDQFKSWLNDEEGLNRQLAISRLAKQISDKKNMEKQQMQSLLIQKSKLKKSGAEFRTIDEKKSLIKKSRIG